MSGAGAVGASATSSGPGPVRGRLGRLATPGALTVVAALVVELAGGGGPGLDLLLVPAALVLLATGARPLLLRLAPAEPDALKLALFGLVLSPPLALGLWLLLRLVLPAVLVLPALFLLLLLLHLAGPGGAPRWPRPRGRAAGLAAVLAVALAAVVALALFGGGTAIRASFHGLLHSAITEEVARALPPENPWLAGRPLPYYWAWHALGALLGEALGLAPTRALALTNVWAAAVLPLALYFLAAPFLREPKRDLGAVLLGLFGLGALGGVLLAVERPAFVPPGDPLQLLAGMRGLVGDWDPRLAWGPSKLGNLSSYPVALSLLVAGWVAAAHALRGRWGEGATASGRTWAVLCAASLGASLAMNPLVGAAGYASAGLVALLRGRVLLLVALAVAALPGLLEVLAASSVREGASFGLRLDGGAAWRALLPVLPLVLAALALLRRAGSGAEEAGGEGHDDAGALTGRDEGDDAHAGRDTAGLLLVVASAVCLAVAALLVFPEDNQYKFVRLAAVPLAVLAAGGLGRLCAARDLLPRGAGLAAVLALVLACGASTWWGARHYAAWSRVDVPLSEAGGQLLPAGDGDLARAFAELRRLADQVEGSPLVGLGRPLLLVQLADRGEHPSGRPLDLWSYDGHRFRGPYNLQGHEAAAFSGMALYADARSYLVDADPAWPTRQQALHELTGTAHRLRSHLADLDRPTFVLVQGSPDEGWLRDPDEPFLVPSGPAGGDSHGPFASMGFGSLWSSGPVTIYGDPRALDALSSSP